MSSPHEQMGRMLTAYWVSQALSVAARLELADRVEDAPRTADELARQTSTHAPSLYRLLRALASVGVFAEDDHHRFHLTPLAECLLRDRPDSQWAMAVMNGEEHYRTWGELLYSVRTGRPSFDKLFGAAYFDYLSRHEESAAVFDQAMVGVHGRETRAMLDAYDFAGVNTLADVGGGNGSLLAAVLRHYPAMQGVLYDLPGVVERARATFEADGLLDRCRLVAGNFFRAAPPGADAYLLRHILHDWDDARCAVILRHIHGVMPPEGRLLVIESVIRPGNEPSFGKLLDLTMLVLPGGRERTEAEFRELFAAVDFHLARIVPTASEVCVLEAFPV